MSQVTNYHLTTHNRQNAVKVIANAIILLAMFPYLSPIPTPFDTQPYALLLSAVAAHFLLLGSDRLIMPRPLLVLLIVTIFAILMYFINSHPDYGYRSLAGYVSIFLLAFVGYRTYKYVSVKPFLVSVFIWLTFGVLQLIVDFHVVDWLTVRSTSGVTRGVTSLAVEPSYYAIVCSFLLLLNEMFYCEGKYRLNTYFLVTMVLLFQLLISASVTGFLLIVAFAGAKFITFIAWRHSFSRRDVRATVFVLAAVLIAMVSVFQVNMFRVKRAGDVASSVLSDPLALLRNDTSISDRGAHIVLSSYSLFYGRGMALGLGTWDAHAENIVTESGAWVGRYFKWSKIDTGRIMSGWGTAIFELGAVGLLFVLTNFWILAMSAYRNRRLRPANLTSMMVILIVMTLSVPLAFPLFGYMLGVHLYHGYAKPDKGTALSADSVLQRS